MKTQAMVVASVYVDGPNGRMSGQTVEGRVTQMEAPSAMAAQSR
jgi:hypothetical protein